MSSSDPKKRCLVAYATPARQYLWPVELPADGSVGDALAAARAAAESPPSSGEGAPEVAWEDASVGIFGELCDRSAIPRDGDRIELYRPLLNDPKEARRARVAARRRAGPPRR